MNDEIKLKDMTDFLENVYKDIKKQPTLEEELEKERKFINKIKGDNEDEIKAILRDLEFASGVFDYTITPDRCTFLKDYITNLQQENERLNHQLELQKELTARNRLRKHCYKSRVEKADWWLREMLKQAKSDETKAIINGTLELLLNGRSDE